MLSLARTSLSLSRILIRASFLKINYKKLNPVGTNIAKNLTFVTFYSTRQFKFNFDKNLNAEITKRIEEKKIENISATPIMAEDSKQKDVEEKSENIDETKKEKEADEEIAVPSTLNPTIISSVTDTDTRKEDTSSSGKDTDDTSYSSWQTMKYTLTIFGITFTAVGMFALMEFGQPSVDEDGNAIEDEFSHMSLPEQYLYRTIKQMNYYKKLINEPSRDKLLPDELKYPYHQPPYTLVLEFKDVIVHPDWSYTTGWRFKKRPGLDQFLEMLTGIYEIVIYTAELGMTVFPILEALDPNNLITYKLVRDATNFVDGHHVKDLDKLNRNLQKVVVVDWDGDNVQQNKDNVLKIKRWEGDDRDTALMDLANFLRVIAMSEIEDVREVLKYYSKFDDPIATFREKQRELERAMYNNTDKKDTLFKK